MAEIIKKINGILTANVKKVNGLNNIKYINSSFFSPQVGIVWNNASSVPTSAWTDVVWGGDKFVAISRTNSNTNIMVSLDGETWTTITSPFTGVLENICYNPVAGRFAIISRTGTVLTSTNGTSWTIAYSTGTGGFNRGIVYGNGVYAFRSTIGSQKVFVSTNLTSWTQYNPSEISSSVAGANLEMGFIGGKFFCNPNDTVNTNFVVSSGAVTWSATSSIASGATATWRGWAGNDAGTVFVATGGVYRLYSYDLTNWYIGSTSSSGYIWENVSFGNGIFVACNNGSTGTRMSYSFDGVNWSDSTISSTTALMSVAYGNGMFVAVGTNTVVVSK